MSRRRSRRREPLTPRRIAGIGAAAALAAFAGWWAVKLTAAQEIGRVNPFVAAIVAPKDPRVQMRLAIVEMIIAPGREDPAHRDAAMRALGRSALADEPFVIEASKAQAAGDAARAERLLLEARRRNPRERLTRLLLVQLYLNSLRWSEAGSEIAVVTRLVPRAQDVLAPGLSKLAANPRYAAPIAGILARNPDLKDTVLGQLAASGAEVGQILRLAGPAVTRPGTWQPRLLQRQVEAGDVRGAYALWVRFGSLPATTSKAIYDPNFVGLKGAAPFNWELPAPEGGHAEMTRSGLQVDYYGRVDALLARQLMLLAPGRYRLAFRAEGSAKGDGGQLQWTIACAKAGGELLRLPLKDVTSPRRLAGDFTVPAGCEGQWLRLSGISGDVATQQSALISGLQIVAPGGS